MPAEKHEEGGDKHGHRGLFSDVRRVGREPAGRDGDGPEHEHRDGHDPRLQWHGSRVRGRLFAEQAVSEHSQTNDGARDGRKLDVEVGIAEQAPCREHREHDPRRRVHPEPHEDQREELPHRRQRQGAGKAQGPQRDHAAQPDEERHPEGVKRENGGIGQHGRCLAHPRREAGVLDGFQHFPHTVTPPCRSTRAARVFDARSACATQVPAGFFTTPLRPASAGRRTSA